MPKRKRIESGYEPDNESDMEIDQLLLQHKNKKTKTKKNNELIVSFNKLSL